MRLTAALLLLSCATAPYEPLTPEHRRPFAVGLESPGLAVPLESTLTFSTRLAPDGGTLLAIGDAGFDRPPRPLEGSVATDRYLALYEPTRCDGGVPVPAPLWAVQKVLAQAVVAEVAGCSDADERTWVPAMDAPLTRVRPIGWALIERGGILSGRADWSEFTAFDFTQRDLLFTRDVVTDWSVFEAPHSRARPLDVHRVTVYDWFDSCVLNWPAPNPDKAARPTQLTYQRTRPTAGVNAVFEVAGRPGDAWVLNKQPSPMPSHFCDHDLEPKLVRTESEAKRLGLDTRGVDFAKEWLAYFPPAEPLHGQASVEGPGIMREHDVWALTFNLVKQVKGYCPPYPRGQYFPPGAALRPEPDYPLWVSPELFTRIYRVPANISAVQPEFPVTVQQELCPTRFLGGG